MGFWEGEEKAWGAPPFSRKASSLSPIFPYFTNSIS